jgi:DNA-binding NarL/FixJ family response regulator
MLGIAVVDHHPVFLFGLQRAFEQTIDLRVVSATTTPEDLNRGLNADVYLVGLDGEDPVPLVDELVQRGMVIVMSGTGPRPIIDACLRLGAVRHLDKRTGLARFCDAIRAAADVNHRRVGPGTPAAAPSSARPNIELLSQREREVLAYIADGYTHAQAAHRIGISPHTVDTYVKRVRAKLGVGNKAELTKIALRGSGFVDIMAV